MKLKNQHYSILLCKFFKYFHNKLKNRIKNIINYNILYILFMMTYKWVFTQIRSLRIIHLLFKIPCTMYTIRILLHPLHHLLFSPNKRSRCVSTGPPFTRPFRRPLLLPLPDINGIWLILKESRLMSSPAVVVVSQLQLSAN